MKTDMFKIGKNMEGWDNALDEAEKCGRYNGLDEDKVLKLRLMGEELMGLMKSIVGDFIGEFWVEKTPENKFEVHVTADNSVSFFQREALLDASKTSEESNKKQGFFNMIVKIWKDYMDTQSVILNDPNIQKHVQIMGLGIDAGDMSLNSWSLNQYLDNLPENEQQKDELEQFIVKSIADDILVSARNNHAELTAVKKF